MADKRSYAERREYARQWAKNNPDKVRESSRRKREATKADPERLRKKAEYLKDWRANNPEKTKAASARYRAKHLEKRRLQDRNQGFKKRYGITIEDRDAMLMAQNNKCAACGSPNPGSKKGWHIDHCHSSGKVRGILCTQCNVALGQVNDDPYRLKSLIAYLEIHSDNH